MNNIFEKLFLNVNTASFYFKLLKPSLILIKDFVKGIYFFQTFQKNASEMNSILIVPGYFFKLCARALCKL